MQFFLRFFALCVLVLPLTSALGLWKSEDSTKDWSVCYTFTNCQDCVANDTCFYCAEFNGVGPQGRCLPLDSSNLCPKYFGTAVTLPQCSCLGIRNCTGCASAGCDWCQDSLTCGGTTMSTCQTPCS